MVDGALTVVEVHTLVENARHELTHAIRNLQDVTIEARPALLPDGRSRVPTGRAGASA